MKSAQQAEPWHIDGIMIRASSLQQPLVEMAPDGVALEVDLVT